MSMNLSGFVRKQTKITIGSTEFIFTELSIADYAKLKVHLVEEHEKTSRERRKRLLEDAKEIGQVDALELLKLTDIKVSEEELEEKAYTVEGIGFLAYLSLSYKHPDICEAQAMKIVTLEGID